MNFKKIGLVLLLVFSLLPVGKIFAQTTNAGFVPGNIWYSKDPFVQGDQIKIYTLIFNPDTRKFSGTVDFFDNSTLLGAKDFSIAGTSTKDISINWTVTAGDHQIFGQIENAKFTTASGASMVASITDNMTSKSSRTVTNKVIAQNISNGINSVDSAFNTTLDSIQNIGDTVNSVVPAPVSQSITKTSNILDGFRENANTVLEKSKKETQDQIDALNKAKSLTKDTTTANAIHKPFEYVKLFFFTILAAIFKYKILFYGLLVIIVLLIINYIWHLIF